MRREYDRLTTISLDQGLALLRLGAAGVPKTEILGETVGISSLRLHTFLWKGVQCSEPGCPLHGEFFAVERSPMNEDPKKRVMHKDYGRWHLNLYAWDKDKKEEVLFTHDHVLARALGGPDTLHNSVPMCRYHNHGKSKLESRVFELLQNADKFTLESGLIYEDTSLRRSKNSRKRLARKLRALAQMGVPRVGLTASASPA
jgi:hypothetical protein